MTNLEFLQDSAKALDFKRRDSVDNYLLGILSVVVGKTEWEDAVATALRLEANVFASVQQTAVPR